MILVKFLQKLTIIYYQKTRKLLSAKVILLKKSKTQKKNKNTLIPLLIFY
jgi:hypothetical protein